MNGKHLIALTERDNLSGFLFCAIVYALIALLTGQIIEHGISVTNWHLSTGLAIQWLIAGFCFAGIGSFFDHIKKRKRA
jgi:hypothetical protein